MAWKGRKWRSFKSFLYIFYTMWRKTLKNYFNIEHIVQVRWWTICIWSGYISDLIVISMDWVIIKKFDRWNEKLISIQDRMIQEWPDKIKELIDEKDVFEKDIPIYTWDKWRVLKKYCEETGRPNICHDGTLIYENTFTENLWEAKRQCMSDSLYSVKLFYRSVVSNIEALMRSISLFSKYVWSLLLSILYFIFYYE